MLLGYWKARLVRDISLFSIVNRAYVLGSVIVFRLTDTGSRSIGAVYLHVVLDRLEGLLGQQSYGRDEDAQGVVISGPGVFRHDCNGFATFDPVWQSEDRV